MIHELKILPEYFLAVVEGRKKFEIRKYDRDYQIGDALLLKEWDREYTGSAIVCEITYILHGGNYGLEKGYCILSIDVKMIGCVDMSNQKDILKEVILPIDDFYNRLNNLNNKIQNKKKLKKMREIKFRGLVKNIDGTKEWDYGYLGRCDRKFTIEDDEGYGCFVDDIETIGQYTGLKDKNETEIYEGDIVKMINYRHKGIIKYINGAFEIDWNDKHLCRNLNYWNKNDSVIEVIGNMFENRELLEENKYE